MSRVPRCEACGREPASSFSWFADPARWYAPRSGTWKFAGLCTANVEAYYVMFRMGRRGWFDSASASAEWLAHLSEKVWFDPVDFAAMLARFVAAGGSHTSQRMTYPKGRRHSRMRANVKASLSKTRTLPRLEERV
jgi:hypothetical protein